MAAEPSWDLYRTFLAALAEGSLSAAARSINIAQPTAGRHIEELERVMGTALFTRSPHGLRPTTAAERLRPAAAALAAAAGAMGRALAGAPPAEGAHGRVRLTCSEIVGVEILPPILRDLRAAHPGVTLDLILSDRVQDLLERDADIAVRMTEPRQARLVRRRVGAIRLGLFAHRDYLDHHGMPTHAEALDGHALIGFDAETPFVRGMLATSSLPLRRDRFALGTDSALAQLALIRAGFGIGIAQVLVARRDPALVHLLPDQVAFTLPTAIVMHEGLRRVPCFRVTFDALAAGLQRHIAQQD